MSKLLYLNLAIDSEDTSLGFAIGWLEEISKNYDSCRCHNFKTR